MCQHGSDKLRILPEFGSLEEIVTGFIPQTIPREFRTKTRYFTRPAKVKPAQAISYLFSSVASACKNGIRGQVQRFLTDQCLCPELSDFQHVHFTNLHKSRYKIKSMFFEQLFAELVETVYEYWGDEHYNFHDMAVVAFDGSQFSLPSSDEIREKYDTLEPNLNAGGRYFPQAMVMTAFDVFRKIPVARTISHTKESERSELKIMLKSLAVKTLAVLDRGYYGYEVFNRLIHECEHEFLAKIPMKGSFTEVQEFVDSGQDEGFITVLPTGSYLNNVKKGNAEMVANLVPITLRIIRTRIGKEEFTLVTSLLDEKLYSTSELIALYKARWEVENYYRDEKMWITLEDFMSESVLGVQQELFAAMIMSLITRVSLHVEEEKEKKLKGEPQYFNAITAIARALPRMVALGIERCKTLFCNLLKEIVKTRYHRSAKFRSFERISRKSQNKWKKMALKKLAALK